MAGSNLTGFAFIPERSEATPGLWNKIFSQLSENIAEANAISNLSSNISTLGMITIHANSNVTNYIRFDDTSGSRSDYIIGSQVGGTADGLNIWDDSGQTMIASFSKQSIRFYQNVVGPVFDTGGALADTLNAAVFGTGADSDEVRIQAAISAATTAGISRVYVPASMYPYDGRLMSFATTVQMVREGGNWSVYDCQAYGAIGAGGDAASCQAAGNAAAANNGICYFPPGNYQLDTSLVFTAVADVQFLGGGGNASSLIMAANGVFLLKFSGVCSRVIIRDLWLGSFVARLTGGGIQIIGTTAVHSDTFELTNLTVQNVPQPLDLQLLDRAVLRNIRPIHSIANSVVGAVMSMRTVLSTIVDAFDVSASNISFPSDVVQVDHDCDSVLFINSQALRAIGSGFRAMQTAGSTGPRLTRFHNCLSESNTDAGFKIESARDVRLSGCHSAVNGASGFNISNGTSVTITDSLALQNGQHGFGITGGQGIKVDGCTSANNGQTTDNTYDGIRVESGVTGVRLINNRCGDFVFPLLTNKQRYGISLGVSTDSIVVIGNDLRDNKTAAFGNFSTGSNNLIIESSNMTTSSTGEQSFAGAVRVPAGTALAPGMTFQSERSLGWYRALAGTMGLAGGNLRMPIQSALERLSHIELWNDATPTRASQVGFKQIAGGSSFGNDLLFNIFNGTSWQTMGRFSSVASQFQVVDGSAIAPSLGFMSEMSLGLYRSGVSTIASSAGTVNLATNAARLSMRTLAASAVTASAAKTNVATNEVVFTIGGASGASLIISSGGTAYIWNSDASTILA